LTAATAGVRRRLDAVDRGWPEPLAVKVPHIGLWFWVVKLVSTAMGEALSDLLDGGPSITPALGVLAALVAFVLALRWQLRARSYASRTYWFAVAMVATFGTMAADALHQALGTPYWANALFYAAILAVLFWRWHAFEGTLSIHSIDSRRREAFYWGTVLATFALGTAVGDMTATNLGLGYLASIVLFAALLVLPAVGWRAGLGSVAMFWAAYVLTRPLGASIADYLDVSTRAGGAGLGKPAVTAVLVVVMVALVTTLSRTGRDVQSEPHYRR
jgi:uncharacterized membrane-anchored protein